MKPSSGAVFIRFGHGFKVGRLHVEVTKFWAWKFTRYQLCTIIHIGRIGLLWPKDLGGML